MDNFLFNMIIPTLTLTMGFFKEAKFIGIQEFCAHTPSAYRINFSRWSKFQST